MSKIVLLIFFAALILYFLYFHCDENSNNEHFSSEQEAQAAVADKFAYKTNSGMRYNDIEERKRNSLSHTAVDYDHDGYIDEMDTINDDQIMESEEELVIGNSYVTHNDNTEESDQYIRSRTVPKDNVRRTGYKKKTYAHGNRGGSHKQALDFLDTSNEVLDDNFNRDDGEFMANDEHVGEYAAYKQEKKQSGKQKLSDIFNSSNFLPNEKSANPEWWDIIPDAVPLKNRHLIGVSKPIGANTINGSLRNATHDIRGDIPNPSFVVSPWGQSTIGPDTNFKKLC